MNRLVIKLLKIKTILFVVCLFVLAFSLQGLSEEVPLVLEDSFIHRLVSEAIERHPSVEASKARVKAAQASLSSVRLWEDPELLLGAVNAEEEMRRDNGDVFLGLDQPLPRVRLYRAEKQRREFEFKAEQATQEITENEVGLAVAESALELALTDDVLDLQAQEIHWVETLLKAAIERAKNPDSSAVESLRLESELSVRKQSLEAARRVRTKLTLTLNLLLGRDAESSWPLLTLSAPGESSLTRETMIGRLDQSNPKLKSIQHQAEAAQADAEASRAMRRPVFKVGLESKAYSGGDIRESSLMFTMSLPWMNRSVYDAELEQAEQAYQAAQNEWSAEKRKQMTELSSLWIEAENQRLLEESYLIEVLPKTEKTAEAVQNAWVSSKASLLEVLEARNALLEVRREQKAALAAERAALQAISALLGEFTLSEGK